MCEWECSHCTQTTSKDLHLNLHARGLCGFGLWCSCARSVTLFTHLLHVQLVLEEFFRDHSQFLLEECSLSHLRQLFSENEDTYRWVPLVLVLNKAGGLVLGCSLVVCLM